MWHWLTGQTVRFSHCQQQFTLSELRCAQIANTCCRHCVLNSPFIIRANIIMLVQDITDILNTYLSVHYLYQHEVGKWFRFMSADYLVLSFHVFVDCDRKPQQQSETHTTQKLLIATLIIILNYQRRNFNGCREACSLSGSGPGLRVGTGILFYCISPP